MSKLGYKEITPDNILERDPILDGFVKKSKTGQTISLDLDDYLSPILAISLKGNIPKEICALFEVARGAMAYGYFFYPIFSLAIEQLLRVTEAAISHKCQVLGAPPKIKSFAQKIDWLVKQKIIPENEKNLWHCIRELRNMASHPTRQMILTPAVCVGTLKNVASQINFLFCN